MPIARDEPLRQERAQKIAEECYADVLAYCRRHAPAGHEAADLAQETFLRFVRSGGHHKGGRPIAYLMRTARSVCIDASRERRLETASLDFDVATEDSPYNDSGLIEALSKLPPVLLEVIELRYREEAHQEGAGSPRRGDGVVWMNVVDRARMRIALRHHYQRQVDPVGDEAIDALVSAMVAEDSRARGGAESRRGFLPFVVAQARFIPIWVWLAQVALVATMVLVARLAGNGVMARWAIGVMSAASVLVCVPTLHSSRLHGVVELECSCRHNAASVLVARLIVLGCSASLCLGVMVSATSRVTGMGALWVALWACPPYFLSCAGALVMLRRCRPSSALLACVAWTCLCCGSLYMLSVAFPSAYGEASLSVWALASLASLAWLSREVVLTVRAASAGLDGLTPVVSASFR